MKTLTLPEAKEDLDRWLAAAARGEEIAILLGSDLIALRKVEVDDAAEAQREYGVTPAQVTQLSEAMDRRYRTLRGDDRLVTVTASQLRELLEEAPLP